MITIPESELLQMVSELHRKRAEAIALLHELEEAYAKRDLADKPGGWRQDPLDWKRRVSTA